MDISSKDADEAFAYLRDHPQADAVRQEALEILADPKQLKKLMRKIDWTIVPMMIGVYFLQFLDKTTISYAAVMGIREDTGLKGQDYSNVAMMFYVGFSGRGVPNAVSRATDFEAGQVFGCERNAVGRGVGQYGERTELCGLDDLSNFTGDL